MNTGTGLESNLMGLTSLPSWVGCAGSCLALGEKIDKDRIFITRWAKTQKAVYLTNQMKVGLKEESSWLSSVLWSLIRDSLLCSWTFNVRKEWLPEMSTYFTAEPVLISRNTTFQGKAYVNSEVGKMFWKSSMKSLKCWFQDNSIYSSTIKDIHDYWITLGENTLAFIFSSFVPPKWS